MDSIYGNPALDKSDGYLPFLGYNQTFTIYAWKHDGKIVMLSIFGRKDETNIIKIEIYDIEML
ncbi:MAG: hypothetical protein HC831_16290 [Chloroflexia bacterium]|nr:hypothetical protein [Chloroflexia bacterium]